MDISNLEPCSTYTVGVSSVNVFLDPGEDYNVTHTTSTINPVTTISVDYSCTNGMVTVIWDLVFGADSYRATAVDGTGTSLNCTSASTSCQISMLKCGEKYQVQVAAVSDDCESTSNATSSFETVPCAPANPQTTHECSSNVIAFSWQPTNGTSYYVATAVDNSGAVTECRTVDNTCYFTDTSCGQFYTYRVYAVTPACQSQVSEPQFVQTSPCLPTNIRTRAECRSDTLITTWGSSAGALSYTVEAEGNNRVTYNCSSSTNNCSITGVPCGEHLSVWIVASNDNCSTQRVLGEVAQTAPCPPTNIEAVRDCDKHQAVIVWQVHQASGMYTATMEDQNGAQLTCTSNNVSNCKITDLPCGEEYNVSVTYHSGNCPSTSTPISMESVPCSPEDVRVSVSCSTDELTVAWNVSAPAENYTTIISRELDEPLYCNSTEPLCTAGGLQCGSTYSVTVFSVAGTCFSLPIPCPPTNVTAQHTCAPAPVPVSWAPSENANQYTAVAVSGSEPCAPSNVSSQVMCGAGVAQVLWSPSMNAVSYDVIATGQGQTLTCSSSTSSCTLSNLLCGHAYDVLVSASDGICVSNYSAPFSQDQADNVDEPLSGQ
ncbi:fibronectin type III domain-containing protein 7-like [Cololabis saira]|uniref:fibronectin type III domain-containing protein 7-like n=1 Tax=Cololabis saira TaxID=129043 RepID=UPI002AD5403F|nr:fibronectin type III domain-containing protein 7-like [Cololabis saira]